VEKRSPDRPSCPLAGRIPGRRRVVAALRDGAGQQGAPGVKIVHAANGGACLEPSEVHSVEQEVSHRVAVQDDGSGDGPNIRALPVPVVVADNEGERPKSTRNRVGRPRPGGRDNSKCCPYPRGR
jgi:hypothetical protein